MNHNKTIQMTVLLGCLIVSLTVNLFPYICHNGVGEAYSDTGPTQSVTTNSIDELVVVAGGFFLEGSGNINQLLNQIELQATNGYDNSTLFSLLDSAIINIQKAKDTYAQIVQMADNCLYNETILKALRNFDYENFRVNASLDTVIFTDVEGYLKNGDVTGVIKHTYDSLISIEGHLVNLKTEISSNNNATTSTAWRINETTSRLLMLGSYVARIFAAL